MSIVRRKRALEANSPASVPPSNWIDEFRPKQPSELAVSAQKVDSVQQWLKMCRPNKSGFLLLTGPPGCGKTATVRVVAEELGFELYEWVSPPDDEYSKENFQSQKEKFFEFLFKASRYQSLFDQKRRLLLVEDFPNILLDQKGLFMEILARYKEIGKSPLIFIATETRSKTLNISFNLFPNEVQSQFGIHTISFNSISATLMKKSLQNLLGNLKRLPGFHNRFKEPSTEVLDSLIVSSQGDIRNAILNLQFVSQKNLHQVSTVKVEEVSNKDLSNKRAKKPKDTKKLQEIGCDETISMMHAIGRVFNPKYDPATSRLSHSPEVLTEAFSTQPNSFVQFMFSNYLPHFKDIPDVANCLTELSLSDKILSEYRDNALSELALNIGIRGAMVANTAPVSGWFPVKGYKRSTAKGDELQERYTRFIGSQATGYRNLESKNTYVMDFREALVKIKGPERARNKAEEEEMEQFELDKAERDLIQQIETVDSD